MTSFFWALGVYAVASVFFVRSGLLRGEGRDERRVLFALVLVLSGIHATAFRTGAANVAANPIVLETAIRGFADTLALLIAIPMVVRGVKLQRFHLGFGGSALVLYFLVAGISTLYSADPIVTAAKTYELGVGLSVVMAAAVGTRLKPKAALLRFVRITVLLESALVVVAVIGFFVLPGVFSQVQTRPGFILPQTMVSPYAHSNGLSSAGALAAVYGLALLLEARTTPVRLAWGTLSSLGTLAVVLASGRQGVAIWLGSILALLWFRRRRLLILLLGPVSAAVVLMYWDVITRALIRNQSLASLSTWSGRISFWESALDAWAVHPWLGYGFGVGGRFVVLKSLGVDRISSLHSGYMETLVGVGLLGSLPLLVGIGLASVWALRSLLQDKNTPEAILLVPLLVWTLVSNGFGAWLSGAFLVFASLVLMSAAQDGRLGPVERGGTREGMAL